MRTPNKDLDVCLAKLGMKAKKNMLKRLRLYSHLTHSLPGVPSVQLSSSSTSGTKFVIRVA